MARLADSVESKIQNIGRITPHNDLYGGPALAAPTLVASQNGMDQKAPTSSKGSSSTFKWVSTQRVVQTWSERSHSLMQTKYSSTACHRSKIVLWLCSPLIECISLLQLWDIYDEFLSTSSIILRRVNYLGIINQLERITLTMQNHEFL